MDEIDNTPVSLDGVIALPANRRITFRRYGSPVGRPVIVLHGTPGSRLKFSAADAPARQLGLDIIAPDRWGYGGTTAHPSPTLVGFAADMAMLADALGLAQFAVMGVSGGGPYAAATAALLPDRVQALALVAPVGPIAGEAVHLSPFHRFCFGPLGRNPRSVEIIFRGFHRLLRLSPALGIRIGNVAVPAADRRVLRVDGVSQRLASTFIEGLSAGAKGPAIDLGLFASPWRLQLSEASMPARVWLGSVDRNVPLDAARGLAAALPACTLQMLDGEGHLWVALHYAKVLAWIADTVGAPQ